MALYPENQDERMHDAAIFLWKIVAYRTSSVTMCYKTVYGKRCTGSLQTLAKNDAKVTPYCIHSIASMCNKLCLLVVAQEIFPSN